MPFIEDSSCGNVVPLWIEGQAVRFDPSHLIDVFSSRQGRIVHRAQGATEADARRAADSAWEAFLRWKSTKAELRRDMMFKVAEIYERRADDIAKWQVQETSCSEVFAHFNIKLAVGIIREFATNISTALVGDMPPIQDGFGFVFKEPIGPVLLIPPWNSSIILATRGVAAALAAGCTVVMKASELCPRTHSMIVEIWEEAGLPKGCLNQVQATRQDAAAVTEALISHRAIRKVEFIGSAAVGRIIGQIAGKHLKPILMELGGKSPAIVLKDANLEKAAKDILFGAFVHQGQICFSTERIIVEESVSETFIQILKQEGSASHFSADPGFAVSKSISKHAHDLIQSARDNGASFIVGDNSFCGASQASLKPTILTGIKETDGIRDEESFGPSATLYVVQNVKEAVSLANDSVYGLSATIHTQDMYQALQMAKDLEYGQIHINTPTVYDDFAIPVCGVKGSGWGNNNSRWGLNEYLYDKTVTLHSHLTSGTSFGKA